MRKLREQADISQEEIGQALGYAVGTARQSLSKIERGETTLTVEHFLNYAKKLKVSPIELLRNLDSPEGQIMPPGLADSPAIPYANDDVIPLVTYEASDTRKVAGYVARPPSLRGVRHGYAVYMGDDQMEPRYAAGWLLYVNPIKPPRSGRDIFIVRRNATPMVRQLERQTTKLLIVKALAERKSIEIPVDDVASLHMIVGADQD